MAQWSDPCLVLNHGTILLPWAVPGTWGQPGPLTLCHLLCRYLVKCLEHFLVTAEEHLMVGWRMIYYIFTDRVGAVPRLHLVTERHLRTLMVENQKRWQDVSMMTIHWFTQSLDPAICREAQ
ncbi:unnamed protein product [Lepidochelys olivacea]